MFENLFWSAHSWGKSIVNHIIDTIDGSEESARDALPPRLVNFIFMQILGGEMWPNNWLVLPTLGVGGPIWEILDPPLSTQT